MRLRARESSVEEPEPGCLEGAWGAGACSSGGWGWRQCELRWEGAVCARAAGISARYVLSTCCGSGPVLPGWDTQGPGHTWPLLSPNHLDVTGGWRCSKCPKGCRSLQLGAGWLT